MTHPARCRASNSRSPPAGGPEGSLGDQPFISGEIADRGPLERGAQAALDTRAREARELERQRAWRDQAAKALTALKADEGTGPINADDLDDDDDDLDGAPLGVAEGDFGETDPDTWRIALPDAPDPAAGDQPEASRAGDPRSPAARPDRPRGR